MNDPDIRQIAAFLAIFDHGSATRAADSAGLTQSALTQALGRLERKLGCQLFQREPSGMRPTEPALLLAPRARRAIDRIGSTRVTTTQIRAFLAFARTGGISAGAQQICVSPASLHRSISDLSLALRESLIERRGRHVFLTRRGEARARAFGVAMAELRNGFAEVEAWLGKISGKIVIGAMPLSRARWLPNAIKRFRTSHPGVHLTVVEGSHGELICPLREGEIDVILGALRQDALFDDISQEAVFEDLPHILARAGHPLLGKNLPLADLAQAEWIMPCEGTPIREHWNNMLEAIGAAPPPVSIECGSALTVRELLLDSDMLTMLSPDQVRVEIESGLLVSSPPPAPMKRTIGIMTRRDWHPTRIQQAMLDILREAGSELS